MNYYCTKCGLIWDIKEYDDDCGCPRCGESDKIQPY